MNKSEQRETEVVGQKARKFETPIVYTNLVGGQDELVFDGCSFVVDGTGSVVHRCIGFEEQLSVVSLAFDAAGTLTVSGNKRQEQQEKTASIYQALVTGVRDYIEKNGFNGIVLGLSGGIDSALTLAIAVDALGPKRVEAVTMPSRFTRDMSVEDALKQCDTLGVPCQQISIEPMLESFLNALQPRLGDYPRDTTEETTLRRTVSMA